MHIQVVKCPCGFEMRVTVSGPWGVARPDREQWERLCFHQIATDSPMTCFHLLAVKFIQLYDLEPAVHAHSIILKRRWYTLSRHFVKLTVISACYGRLNVGMACDEKK